MTQPATADKTAPAAGLDTEFRRGLGLYDATMVVIGSMIGSGIFIVSADMSRSLGSPGWLLVAWVVTGVLTVTAALSYGELAAMMPRAGGQYVYLREAFSPLCGFLYGWTLFLVIQTGTIAAVGVAFAKFLGVVWPHGWRRIALDEYLIPPLPVFGSYYVSLSTAQLVAVVLIGLLTLTNVFGLQYGKWIQNVFTTAKAGALFGLIVACLLLGWKASTVEANFGDFWTPHQPEVIEPALSAPAFLGEGGQRAAAAYNAAVGRVAATTAFGLLVALCVVQTGSLFSSDAWNNITFAAGEVKEPRRTIPLSLALGTGTVIALYLLANVGYLATLPFDAIRRAPEDRVGTAALEAISSEGVGVALMAVAIMVSTFGCTNGLILAGARAYYAMARDGLFFRAAGRLNAARVPAWGLVLQGVWAALLVLPRVRTDEGKPVPEYGNLYSNLLDYIISAALIFYILTIVGIFRLRRTRPDAERPYRAFGYPVVPALYVVGAGVILLMLFLYRPATTWPGLVIVLLGLPVYFLWRRDSSFRARSASAKR
jgi:APA family basic amino acid/polyamine antiporter